MAETEPDLFQSVCSINFDGGVERGFIARFPSILIKDCRVFVGLITSDSVIPQKNSKYNLNFDDNYIHEMVITDDTYFYTSQFLGVTVIEVQDPDLRARCLQIDEKVIDTTFAYIADVERWINSSLSLENCRLWGYSVISSLDRESHPGEPILNSDWHVIGVVPGNYIRSHSRYSTIIAFVASAIERTLQFGHFCCLDTDLAKLPDEKILKLEEIGLESTDNPLLFISPGSPMITPLWFCRTAHGWYWTPTRITPHDIELKNFSVANWMEIGEFCQMKVIGGRWNSIEPARKNRIIIGKLAASGALYL